MGNLIVNEAIYELEWNPSRVFSQSKATNQFVSYSSYDAATISHPAAVHRCPVVSRGGSLLPVQIPILNGDITLPSSCILCRPVNEISSPL